MYQGPSAATRYALAAVIVLELILGLGAAAVHDPGGTDSPDSSAAAPFTSEPVAATAIPTGISTTTTVTAAPGTAGQRSKRLDVYGDPDPNGVDVGPAGRDPRGRTWTEVASGKLPDESRWRVNARARGAETCLSVTQSDTTGAGSAGEGCYRPFAGSGGSSGGSAYQYADGLAPSSAATVVLTTRDGRSGELETKASPVSDARIFWGFFDCQADIARVEGFDAAGRSVGHHDYPKSPAGFEPACRVPSGS